MPAILVSRTVAQRYRDDIARFGGGSLEAVPLPSEGFVPEEDLNRIEGGYFSTDLWSDEGAPRRFFGAVRRAPNLRWLHISFAGTDNPIFQELMDRGVTVTNSSGAASEPIALTVVGAMLALHRGIPRWLEAQQRRAWEPLPRNAAPPDLRGQTLTIVGLGHIGQYVARFARPLGLHVVGVRRSPAGPEDGIDEWVPSDRLREVLPRTHWLVLALPLTANTRRLIDAECLALLPRGAHLLNVARGPIVDEPALIDALRSGHLAGAYLDVFEQEPLPEDSPLWALPNVIVSPHDASPAQGNADRADAMFLEELACFATGRPFTRAVTDR